MLTIFDLLIVVLFRVFGMLVAAGVLFLSPHLFGQSRASLSAIYFQQFTKAPPGSLLGDHAWL